MRKRTLLILLLVVTLLMTGCPRRTPEPQPQETTETVTLTYGDEEIGRASWRVRV